MYNNLISFNTNALTDIIKLAVREELENIINQQNVNKTLDTRFTRQQTADLLSISLTTLSRWTREGKIKSRSIGNKVYYYGSDIDSAMIKTN